MIYLMVFPFFLQVAVIFFDEFYFHWKRGLPRWERIGHPLDTLSVALCYGYVLAFPFNELHLKIYIGLALFSCIFVTKDEFIHKECSPASEQWLHALLFINHPITLALLGMLWPIYKADQLPSLLLSLASYQNKVGVFLWMQALFTGCFALYQAIYWNVIRKKT